MPRRVRWPCEDCVQTHRDTHTEIEPRALHVVACMAWNGMVVVPSRATYLRCTQSMVLLRSPHTQRSSHVHALRTTRSSHMHCTQLHGAGVVRQQRRWQRQRQQQQQRRRRRWRRQRQEHATEHSQLQAQYAMKNTAATYFSRSRDGEFSRIFREEYR